MPHMEDHDLLIVHSVENKKRVAYQGHDPHARLISPVTEELELPKQRSQSFGPIDHRRGCGTVTFKNISENLGSGLVSPHPSRRRLRRLLRMR